MSNTTTTSAKLDVAPQLGTVSLGPNGTYAYTPPSGATEFTDRFSFAFETASGEKAVASIRVVVAPVSKPIHSQAGSSPEILAARQRELASAGSK